MAQTCAGCQHWDRADGAPDVSGAEHRGQQAPGKWGTCRRILRYGSSAHEEPPTLDEPTDDPAYLSDGSGYFASLTTRSDFGCRLWEGLGVIEVAHTMTPAAAEELKAKWKSDVRDTPMADPEW